MNRYYLLCALCVLSGAWSSPALAYIDPASGSAVISAIIGFFVAVGLAVKTYWYKLKAIFSSRNSTAPEEGEEGEEKREEKEDSQDLAQP